MRKFVLLLLVSSFILVSSAVFGAENWQLIGPEGGDVRSLAYDPGNPDRILLGTSAGQLFESQDNGKSWAPYAHLGPGDDYVLDHIVFDPTRPATLYVAGWSLFKNDEGDVFRSDDGGKTWRALSGIHNKSVRTLAIAPGDHNVLVAGALDGVYRSRDAGTTWERISPEGDSGIKNIESTAIDPQNPDVIYVGTFHLPWKTDDGGKSWHRINQGVLDDSDVFSIIIDPQMPRVLYASACSGIYKSMNNGELFARIKGIPHSAIRTRVLKQDPKHSAVIYAGTTGGLWKTFDGGGKWELYSASDITVNDISIDPRNPERVLLATDRGGILASNNGFEDYAPSNSGFAHRTVGAVLIDRSDTGRLYVGVVNDKDLGGFFTSGDGGKSWKLWNKGLNERDVFALQQANDGVIFAGTNHGIFYLTSLKAVWEPANMYHAVLPEWRATEEPQPAQPRKTGKSKASAHCSSAHSKSAGSKTAAGKTQAVHETPIPIAIAPRIRSLLITDKAWYAATSEGLFISVDEGKKWYGEAVLGEQDLVGVQQGDSGTLAVVSPTRAFVSNDAGERWAAVTLPSYVTVVYGLAPSPDGSWWLSTREGALHSTDQGKTWEHRLGGLPAREILSIHYDAGAQRLLATGLHTRTVFESKDGGKSWQQLPEAIVSVRAAMSYQGRILAATTHNGLLLEKSVESVDSGKDPGDISASEPTSSKQ
jgi:photosystem II stability/assembly factor-like uncharacterized protein